MAAVLFWPAAATANVPATAGGDPTVESSAWTDEHDEHFQKYSKRYFGPGFDWRWFKAQAIAESRLDTRVRSPAGAVGIMQILPSTYAEIRGRNPYFRDITSPRWNIAAGIYYDRYLFSHDAWAGIADQEKLLLAFAGYNAGLGGVLKAWRRATPAQDWQGVRPHAPAQTREYVSRIARLKGGPAVEGRGGKRLLRQKGLAGRLARGRRR